MTYVLAGLEYGEIYLRQALFWIAAALAVIFAVDWLVRTRRINPFGPVARFFRSAVDPLIVPIERQVIRAGGTPASAPWWALVFVVVGGIVLLALLDYLRAKLTELMAATYGAPGGIARVLIEWIFLIFQVALIVRVISSWVGFSPYSRWVRWSYGLTEWMLRPLRRIIPTVGMFDISPLVAWFGLNLLQWLVLSLLPRTL